MSVPNGPTTALAGDLPTEQQQLAFQEGHDADIPTNLGTYDGKTVIETSKESSTRTTSLNLDLEKAADVPATDSAVDDGPSQPPDPNVVWWSEPVNEDPENPMNWPEARKWGNIAILSLITLITPLASSIFAPGVLEVMAEFHSNSETLATFVVSVYVLGFAFGPLFVAPLSEVYGRMPVYHISNLLFVILTIACAVSSNLNMLIGFRFLVGCVGATPLTIGGGTIADIMPTEKRGGAMALWALGPLLGPSIGPVAGGYLCQSLGWRWVFWVLAIASGVFSILAFFLMRETYAPVILARKAARLRKETGNELIRSKLDSGIPAKELFIRSIVRPSKMLVLSPIVAIMSTFAALMYGVLYLLFTTFTFVFSEQYHFSQGSIGLVFIPIGVGLMIGLIFFGATSDKQVKKKAAANGGVMKPEYRLPPLLPAAPIMIIGLLIYGWSADKHAHWIVPMIGTAFVGLGLLFSFFSIQTYLVDAFTVHAASAMAANTVLRSLFGALLPLCGLKMYNALGLGWGNTLLAFLCLGLAPVPFLFLKYGERLRTSKRFHMSF